MDVFSTELGIRPSFVNTSDFRGGGGMNSPNPPPSVRHWSESLGNLVMDGNIPNPELKEMWFESVDWNILAQASC
jgi:hypothetical protein